MVTKIPSDEYVLKVLTLRNIALTAPYFHSGQTWDLRQVAVIMGASQLGTNLSDDGVGKVTAFCDSLMGEPPKVTYPILPPSGRRHPSSGTVIPLDTAEEPVAHGIRCAGGGQGDNHESEHGDSKPHPYDNAVAFH